MRYSIYLVILLFFTTSLQANEIAFTFDDSPRGDEQIYTGVQRTQKLIEVLAKYNIQVAFFSNSDKMPRANGYERLKAYGKAGHIIANHTHSHPRLDDVGLSAFIANIDQGHEKLKSLPNYVKWFRYPFLNEGKSLELRDGVRAHLASQNYLHGYVTVDNYDYYINEMVQRALKAGKPVDMDKACQMLVDLMWDGIMYYDGVAQKHIGKIRHVLLMHENDLEAFCLDKLINHLHSNGWKIISPKNAFEDPLLAGEPGTLYLNQVRVAAIAHAKTGIKYQSKWESTQTLDKEFARRKIVQETK